MSLKFWKEELNFDLKTDGSCFPVFGQFIFKIKYKINT